LIIKNKIYIFMRKELILALSLIFVLSGCSLGGGGTLSTEEAKTEAESFVNQYLMGESQEEATVEEISEEGGMYKMKFKVAGQTIESYMTKDGKTFFPQALDMENPQGDTSSQGNAAPQQQQMSPAEQAESMASQGRGLLDQYGDSISDEARQELENKLDDLEELNGSDNPGDEELQTKMQEVQEASQPLIEEVMEQQQQQGEGGQGGETQGEPQE
jgi:hypothetical protein